MSAHKYIRILCNGIKVRSTGNKKWQREQVLEEELGYSIKKHHSYGVSDCMLSGNMPDKILIGSDCVHYVTETKMAFRIMNALLSLTPEWMIQNKNYKVIMFQAELVKSSAKLKIKTIKDIYDIGFYLERVHDKKRDLDLLELKCKSNPNMMLAFKVIECMDHHETLSRATDEDMLRGMFYSFNEVINNRMKILNERCEERAAEGRTPTARDILDAVVGEKNEKPYIGDNITAHD